jgi:hypothetical protein
MYKADLGSEGGEDGGKEGVRYEKNSGRLDIRDGLSDSCCT